MSLAIKPRPRSFVGGDLHWIWELYGIYQEVDHIYGLPAYASGNGFPNAQAFMNVIETFLNLSYVYLAHVSQSPAAPVIGFAAIVMTLSKTVLYFAQEIFCGMCGTGQNNLFNWTVYWIIPNGTWIVVPSIIVWRLGQDIAASLKAAQRIDNKKEN